MEIHAKAKFVRISPKKARSLLARLRGMKTSVALDHLKYHRSKTAQIVRKLISSAVSNAKNNYNFKEDNLKIQNLVVDDGPMYKRYWLRSRGSADRLLKRTGHFHLTLAEIHPTVVKKPVAKPVQPKAPTDTSDSTKPAAKPEVTKPAGEAPKPKTSAFKKIFTRRTTNK